MKPMLKLSAIAAIAAILTACGGGGGGGTSVANTPQPGFTPVPSPTPVSPAPTPPVTGGPAATDSYGNALGTPAPYVMNTTTPVQERFTMTFRNGGYWDTGFANTAYSERTMQESWITGDVMEAWKAGWTGKGQKIGILDDFTANDSSEYLTYRYSNGLTINVPFTHGQVVSAIAGGSLSSFDFVGNYNGEPLTGTYHLTKPLYGIAKDAQILRNDFLTHQGNGLFATMKSWSANNDASWRSLTVVNLSLGADYPGYTAWNNLYSHNLSIANTTNYVPDAVFVKAAGNDSVTAIHDYSNQVLVSSSTYGPKTIIVGALDPNTGQIAHYSNTAGSGSIQGRFLVADGSTSFAGEGTSFAAPRVAGYAAIVRHKFSALDAATTATHLLNTTSWNSAWGAKNAANQAIYGQGEANLSRALAPSQRLR